MKHLVLIAIAMILTAAAQAREPRPVVHGDWEMPASEWAQKYHPANFIKVGLSKQIMDLTEDDIARGLGTVGALVAIDKSLGASGIVVSGKGQPFDLLLSAAHVFFDEDCKQTAKKFAFLYGGKVNTKRYVRLKHVVTGGKCFPDEIDYSPEGFDIRANDWAIAILENTKVTDSFGSLDVVNVEGPLGQKIRQLGADFMTAGYHNPLRAFMKSPNGHVFDEDPYSDPRLIFTNSSTTGGWSGGPGLVDLGDELKIVGTLIGGPRGVFGAVPNLLVRTSGEFAETLIDLRNNGLAIRKKYGDRWIQLK